jgi:4-hydroxybenzoate polyprenyltransferase/phosphoserine phosphatase
MSDTPPTITAQSPQTGTARPLCVDLDGTLIAGDMLVETAVHLLRHRPMDLLMTPFWLANGGRAGLKQQLAARGTVDPRSLPYRADVIAFLREQHAAGRTIILTTAADAAVAHPIAEHLGLFDRVLCSDGVINLDGENKLRAVRRVCPDGFDYVGDSRADLPLWKAAGAAYLVAPSPGLLRDAQAVCKPARGFESSEGRLGAVLRVLRPHQWSKNMLLFLPLFLAHQWQDVHRLLAVVLAVISFSLCASAVYVANDLLDVHDDRHHAQKSKRPFASGALPLTWGPVILLGLLSLAFIPAAAVLPGLFIVLLASYFCTSSSYSMYFKRKLLIDVMLLAGLYTMRLIAGGAACLVEVSPWLLAFSIFVFTSLAFAKRYAELRNFLEKNRAGSDLGDGASAPIALRGRGYRAEDLDIILVVGPCSGYIAVLVFALYIYSSDLVNKLYYHPLLLWLVCPLMLYWITRIWFIARRGWLNEDPVLFAIKDRVSWYSAGIAALLILAALW